jgi:hypothetical protein
MVIGHRQVFCWIDQWFEMSMEDIRAYEVETKRIIEERKAEEEAAKAALEAAKAAQAAQPKAGWFW